MRKLVSTGSQWETKVGYSRTVIRPAFALVHALPFVDDAIFVEVEAVAVRAAS